MELTANRYHVRYEGTELALAHILPHPQYEGQVTISVIPDMSGGGAENGLKNALYGRAQETAPEIDAIRELVISAGLDPEKVAIEAVDARGG